MKTRCWTYINQISEIDKDINKMIKNDEIEKIISLSLSSVCDSDDDKFHYGILIYEEKSKLKN